VKEKALHWAGDVRARLHAAVQGRAGSPATAGPLGKQRSGAGAVRWPGIAFYPAVKLLGSTGKYYIFDSNKGI